MQVTEPAQSTLRQGDREWALVAPLNVSIPLNVSTPLNVSI